MKKILLLTLALTAILSLNAQKFGLKIGVNLSGVNSSTTLQDYQSAALNGGLNGGLVFEISPVKRFGFRTEALFSQKGYEIESDVNVDGTDAVINSSLTLNYIEVPLLLKIKLGPAYITAGPYLAYAVSGEDIATITVDGQKLAEDQYADYGQVPSNDIFKDGEFNGDNITYNRTDAGINVGFGVKLLKFFAEARYGTGLANIKSYDGMPSDEYMRNYTINFSIGILF